MDFPTDGYRQFPKRNVSRDLVKEPEGNAVRNYSAEMGNERALIRELFGAPQADYCEENAARLTGTRSRQWTMCATADDLLAVAIDGSIAAVELDAAIERDIPGFHAAVDWP